RRLVIVSQNPERLAGFYTEAFGLAGKNFSDGVVLTDGVMQLVLLKRGGDSGLYGYGLAANGDETAQRVKTLDAAVGWEPDWLDGARRQMVLRDPEQNLVALFGAD